jgi:hypothetical protein
MQAAPTLEQAVASEDLDGFLAEVEDGIRDAAQVVLLYGGQPRLTITLLKHERNPRVIWGLKVHEDWAFKATLLRFARDAQPAHLLRVIEKDGACHVQGWEIHRTMEAFESQPLPTDRAEAFWARLQEAHTAASAGAN